MILDFVEQTKFLVDADWLAWRKEGLGGSDMAGVLNLTTYASPISVFLEKTGRTPPIDDNPAMAMGKALEPYLAKRVGEQLGFRFEHEQLALVDTLLPWRRATLDLYSESADCLAELKTTRVTDFLEEPPLSMLIQCQWQLSFTDCQVNYLAVLDRTSGKLAVHEVERDDQVIADLVEAGQAFWNRVVADDRPELDWSKATTAALQRVVPEKGAVVDLTQHHEALEVFTNKIASTTAQIKAAEQERDYAKNAIRLLMLDAEVGELNGDPFVTYKRTDVKGYEVAPTFYYSMKFPKKKETTK